MHDLTLLPPSSLIERIRHGDRMALNQLLGRLQTRLLRIAERQLPRNQGRITPSDVLQSTYIRVLEGLDRFRGATEAEFRAWVVRIMERRLAKRIRFHTAARRQTSREVALDPEALLGDTPEPITSAALREDLSRMAEALTRLPQDYMRILHLHMDPEQTHARTARILGRSEMASRVLLARARAALLVEMARSRGIAG